MNDIQSNKFPWYLPLAAAYPVLTLYAANVDETDLLSVGIAVAVTVTLSLVFWLLIGAIVKNIWRAALPVSVAILFFFLYKYGQIVSGLGHTVYLPLHSVLGAVAIALTWLIDCRRGKVRIIAIVATSCLVAAALLQAAGSGIIIRLFQESDKQGNLKITERHVLSAATLKKFPDVYCIILDSYANCSALSNWFQFDNTQFINALKTRGFNLPQTNASNYAATKNAIPSLLNMGYSNSENNVPAYLVRKGYEFWYSRSVYNMDKSATLADRVLGDDYGTEFWHQLVLLSMLGPSWKTFGNQYRNTILNNFKHLEESAKNNNSKPLFMFAHIMVPHSPFVFKADGNSQYLLYTGSRKDIPKLKAAYVEQCLFANNKVLVAIDAITSSERGQNAVIVLMGDHGPFYQLFSPKPEEGINENWESAMYQNLLAIRLPHGDVQKIPDLTNVNVFRWILHKVFKEDYNPISNKFFRDYVGGENPADATLILGPQLGFPSEKKP